MRSLLVAGRSNVRYASACRDLKNLNHEGSKALDLSPLLFGGFESFVDKLLQDTTRQKRIGHS